MLSCSLGIQLPNGILLSFGPFNGNMHDAMMFHLMDLRGLLATHCQVPGKVGFSRNRPIRSISRDVRLFVCVSVCLYVCMYVPSREV